MSMNTYKDTPKLPQTGKTGYDIRTDILMMAKDLALRQFDAEMDYWKISLTMKNDPTNNPPQFPSMDKVLDIANRMNDFVGKK